jgi:hypothetical protein
LLEILKIEANPPRHLYFHQFTIMASRQHELPVDTEQKARYQCYVCGTQFDKLQIHLKHPAVQEGKVLIHLCGALPGKKKAPCLKAFHKLPIMVEWKKVEDARRKAEQANASGSGHFDCGGGNCH